MSKLDPRWIRASAGYIGVVMVAWAGLLPGTGERFPGDPTFVHPYRISLGAAALAAATLLVGINVIRVLRHAVG
jgi:hypothetical protein